MQSAWQTSLTMMFGLWVVGLPGSSGSELAIAATPHVQTLAVRHGKSGPASSGTAVAPDIVLTGATRQTRAVEARAAAFVRAVRHRDGVRAVRFLSRQTAPRVRAAVARRDWPWRTAAQDLGLLFARRDLRLRTLAVRPQRARVRLEPRLRDPNSMEAIGFYDLGMVREGARWQVLLPAPAAPRTGTRRQ